MAEVNKSYDIGRFCYSVFLCFIYFKILNEMKVDRIVIYESPIAVKQG